MLASVESASKCKKFVCKSFNAGPDDTCVFVNNTKPEQLVRTCDKKACSALAWPTAQTTTNATCVAIPDPPKIVNQTAPGDVCNATTECFGLTGEVTCDKLCNVGTRAVDFCIGAGGAADHRWCKPGFYCDSTTTKKCAAQKNKGEVCASNDECTTGFTCIKAGDATTFTCTQYWSLAAGTKFDASHTAARGPLLPIAAACASHWAITPTAPSTTYECRRAPQNQKGSDLGSLKKTTGEGESCPYQTFDGADVNAPVNKTGTSYCGFNIDDAGYCDKQLGDKWFNDTLAALVKAGVDKVKCNPRTSYLSCGSLMSVFDAKTIKSFYREYISTPDGKGAGTGYALYAHNAKCVAQSITAAYWMGDSPNFGFSTLTMTSFAGIILTISALFYIF